MGRPSHGKNGGSFASGLRLEDGATLSTGADFTITNGQVSVASEGGKLTLTGAQELSLVCGSASMLIGDSRHF